MIELGIAYGNYIGGEWQAAASGETAEIRNPADADEIVGTIPLSGEADLHAAASAARMAAPAWRRLSGPQRAAVLERSARILESRRDEIAETMTREMGKTLPESRAETERGVAILQYYAGEGWRRTGDVIPSTDSRGLLYTVQDPLGVVGLITPWNFPAAIPLWKLAPALIYGNTAVLKPSEEAAITALKLMECFAAAGLPAGVANAVCGGAAVGRALVRHADITGISFTGSERAGRWIAVEAAARGAKAQLEMGGKNPLIVAADADLDLAAEAAVSGAFRTTGQKCTATSRVIVLDQVYEAFAEKLLAKTKGIAVGNGLTEGVWMGPCAGRRQLEAVLGYVETGKAEGARLLCGGERLRGSGYERGYYVAPTIFAEVRPNMRIAREEIFGPVLSLIRVGSLREAIDCANDSRYGLSAAIYTRDIGHMLQFARDMEAGMLRVNAETAGVELQAPFGGMKASGSFSREQGQAAAQFYTATKTVFIR